MSAFYTPETVQPRPATEPLPAEDHAFVHSVTTSDHLAIGRQQPIKRPPLDEVPGRSVSIDVIHVDYSGYVTEYLEVLVTVANTGSEPIDPGGDFPARVAAQWSTELGESVLVEGRADFLGPLKPGAAETTLMLLPIPDTEGEYVLSIGLVEEGRQWLGRAPEISFSAVTQPRVTIAGGYSRHRHLGDDLVTRSLIEEIQGAFPQVKISLLSDRPEPVGDRFGVTAVEDAVTIYKHDTDEGVSPTSAIASIVSLAREHLDGTRIADARIAALTDHVAGSDLLVIAAAGSLASEFADAILWPRLIETEIADAAGVPIVVTSAGVGPFTSDEHIAAAKRLLDMARDVHARDRQTLSLLEEVGVDGPVTTFVPDAAMGIGAAQAHDIERFLTEVGLVDETFVVASARPGDTIETVEQIARAADSAASEQDAVVVLLPHCTSEWIDDRPALERLEGLLGSVRAVVMIDAMPPDPIAADLIRLAASTVGTRFHNAVLSASVGRPTILITQSEYDQHRAAGFAGLSGVAVSVITPSTRLTARRIRAALRQKPATPRYPKPHPVVTVMHALGIGRR